MRSVVEWAGKQHPPPPCAENGGPLADSSKSIPRSIDKRWRMIPGDGRIVGKANAKADNRPHADLLPQKSSDEIPNFMLQFGYPFARDPKNPRSGNGDPEPNSAFKIGDQDVQRNAGDNIPNELEVQRNNAMQVATFLMSWRCSALHEAAFLMSKKCSAMQEATFLMS